PAPPPPIRTQDRREPEIDPTRNPFSGSVERATPPIQAPARPRQRSRLTRTRAGLPIERSYVLGDGEDRARAHPISKEIEIEYADYEGEITTRTVGARSVLVTDQRGYVYLFGYCHLREDERCFRVDRIIRIRTDDSQLSQRVAIDAFFTS
ncbi:WYL domain-containing protein, partial [Thermaurantiacus sp.]